MNEESIERVKDFVARQTGEKRETLTLARTLVDDLGLWGDDMDEFFWNFFEEFHVDPAGIDVSRYTGAEGEGCPVGCILLPYALVYRLFRGEFPEVKWWEYPYPLQPVTIEDLVRAVEVGKWCLPPVSVVEEVKATGPVLASVKGAWGKIGKVAVPVGELTVELYPGGLLVCTGASSPVGLRPWTISRVAYKRKAPEQGVKITHCSKEIGSPIFISGVKEGSAFGQVLNNLVGLDRVA